MGSDGKNRARSVELLWARLWRHVESYGRELFSLKVLLICLKWGCLVRMGRASALTCAQARPESKACVGHFLHQ